MLKLGDQASNTNSYDYTLCDLLSVSHPKQPPPQPHEFIVPSECDESDVWGEVAKIAKLESSQAVVTKRFS
eukprot:352356-Pleurochrysis_carterae.AAC.1